MKDPYENYFFVAVDAIITIDSAAAIVAMCLALPIYYLLGNAGGLLSGIIIEFGGFLLILDFLIIIVCLILWYCSSTKEDEEEEVIDEFSPYLDDDYFV